LQQVDLLFFRQGGSRVIAQLEPEQKDFALTLGGVAAVVWGVAVSLYAFSLGSLEIGWEQYMGALIGGIAACLALPPLVVFTRSWLRLHPIGPFGRH
jgi:hypothetical protein